MPVTIGHPEGAPAVRPFTVPEVPEAELDGLRARVAATRWPDQETVTDDSQGVPLAMAQELARYWAAARRQPACPPTKSAPTSS